MGGPVYHYNAALNSTVKFPQSLDGQFFAGEYGRKWIKPVKVNADGSPGEISTFPWAGTQVMDMAFGPDGALYVLDYGTGSDNQALYRIEYIGGGNRAPTATLTADKTSGPNPLTVNFSSAGSSDPEGGALTYAWDFDGNGTIDSTAANPSFTYTTNGTKTPTLTVKDPQGATGSASTVITVGNTAPTVKLNLPANGQLFSFGDTVPFNVTVTDPEDGTIDCSKVTVTYFLGHDQHSHQITSKTGCTGSITVPVDGEHDASANIFGIFDAAYTDNGGLTGHGINTLQPRHRQGEHFGAQSGVQVADHAAAEGGHTAGYIENGDWISYTPYLLNNATSFTARVASAGSGGTIEVRTGSPTGPLLGTATVASTGSWETFTDVTTNITAGSSTATALYLVFKGGTGYLFDVDSFTFATGTPTAPVVSLKSLTNNNYVTAADATTNLIANSTTIGTAQQYDLIDLGGGKIALRAKSDGQFVCADNAGANPLIANRAAQGSWETFNLIRNSDGSESLQATVNGMYVTAENNGAQALIANRTAIGPWEKFDLIGY